MSEQRITINIMPWRGERKWKAEMRVDGYAVEKSFHNSHEEALKWCESKRAELQREVRS